MNALDIAQKHLQNSQPIVLSTKLTPRSREMGLTPSNDWTSGFYPGCLWIMYDYTKDESIRNNAETITGFLVEERYNTNDSKIGLKIYSSFGKGLDLTNNASYRAVVIEAAKSLATRLNVEVGALQSLPHNIHHDWTYPVSIDDMMNLELLFAASELSGNPTYYSIAKAHAITTLNHHFRSDNSCKAMVDCKPKGSEVQNIGFNNETTSAWSAWSRGQAWALYGFTSCYRWTKDVRFLERAEKSALFILNNPNLPDDMVPYWDFHSDTIPTARDAAAAAIIASALLELSSYPLHNSIRYFKAGESMLKSLSSPQYLAEPGTNSNFILKHATGNFNLNTEVDDALIYADYYYIEGLLRYVNKISSI
ncbi:MAG: glycoside hydrolase family 88 protein [Cyclobacteriaceae bacterium]